MAGPLPDSIELDSIYRTGPEEGGIERGLATFGYEVLLRGSRLGTFDNRNFLVGQTIQFVDESVNLAIRGIDLALEYGLLLRRLDSGELLGVYPIRARFPRPYGTDSYVEELFLAYNRFETR